MKLKFTPLALALFCTALTFSACGGSESSTEPESTPKAEESVPIATGDFEAGEPSIGDEDDATDATSAEDDDASNEEEAEEGTDN